MLPAFPEIDGSAHTILDIPNQTGTPERRLILAILERAILDFVGNDQKEILEAEAWIFGDDDDAENNDNFMTFSFAWVCQQLDLDIEDIREKIRAMPKRGESRLAPWYLTKVS